MQSSPATAPESSSAPNQGTGKGGGPPSSSFSASIATAEIRTSAYMPHTLMQRPELYENMAVAHLEEVERVVLSRLAAVVTPDQKELQVCNCARVRVCV